MKDSVYKYKHSLDEVLTVLKAELAVGEDNHCDSGFGGNPTQLFFLITRPEIILRSNKSESSMSMNQSGVLTITIAHSILKQESIETKELRVILDNLCKHSNQVRPITQAQISNVSFLRDQNVQTRDMHLLIRCLEEAQALHARFKNKEPVYQAAGVLFATETKRVESLFLKEMNLPANALDELEERDHDQIKTQPEREHDSLWSMLDGHPIWGQKLDEIGKRHETITQSLVSEDDKTAIKFINTFPGFAKICALRTTLGIETIVIYNLDELGLSSPI